MFYTFITRHDIIKQCHTELFWYISQWAWHYLIMSYRVPWVWLVEMSYRTCLAWLVHVIPIASVWHSLHMSYRALSVWLVHVIPCPLCMTCACHTAPVPYDLCMSYRTCPVWLSYVILSFSVWHCLIMSYLPLFQYDIAL